MSWLFNSGRKSTQDSSPQTSTTEFVSEAASQAQQNAMPTATPALTPSFDFSSFDASRLHPLAGASDTLEYLSLEDEALNSLPGSESALPSRGWSDDLCYGTGTTYLTCLGLGGAYGLVEGLRNSRPNDSFRLRLNTVLNSVTRRGPFLGNNGAVVAVLYNIVNSAIGNARGKHDAANSVASGFLAGVLFKSTRGLRPALNAGGIAGAAALIWSLSKTAFVDARDAAAEASQHAHAQQMPAH
ncbi:Mitochondrial import inner membrane translocase subunit tim23 [Savitreella phatthalungensis]